MIETDLETDPGADEEPVARPAGPDPSALLARLAETTPTATALVGAADQRRAWTWGELAAEVDAVAAGLVAEGLVAGHRLAVAAPNSAEFVLVALAALRAGIVLVPLDPALDPGEARRQLLGCGARMLLVGDAATGAALTGELPELRVRPIDPAGLAELASANVAEVVTPADPETLAVLLSTSGISADPVPAMISRRALAASLDQLIRLEIADPDSTYVAAVPLWTAFGLVLVLGGWLVSGSTLVVPDGRAELTEVLQSEGITHLPATPPMIFRLLRHRSAADEGPLASVRLVLSAGAALPADLAAEFTRRTGQAIEQGYGLTECAGVASTIGAGPWRGHGHVGRALSGIEIRVGDGSDQTEPGEIFVRGAGLFSGYWPEGRDGPDGSGWFGTGDLGYLDGADLFLADRIHEAVVVDGFSVYPTEVEQALGELPGIGSVAVLGAPRGDVPGRQEIVAFVEAKPGTTLTVDDVLSHARSRLARFKQPRRVVLLDRLPRVSAGLVSKAELRRMLAQTPPGQA